MRLASDHGVRVYRDDRYDARNAAQWARILETSKSYAGRSDLLELALGTCLELRREQGEYDLSADKEQQGSPAERALGRRGSRIVENRLATMTNELMAMYEAMDRLTKVKFDDAVSRMPVPKDLV
jgi:hypothetical protein